MIFQTIKINKKTVVEVAEIMFLQSSSNYTIIFTSDNYFISTKHLKVHESVINNHNFIRINRGLLVNLFFVKAINLNKSNPFVTLYNSKTLNISRRKYSLILYNSLSNSRQNITYQF